ncbi:MAG TPA: tetrahydromethanopterin S-methyltransferase subunit A, partial [Methanomethylovorans sp.]|nr:tetrahydromethanopterin S-methyltransferase subunit A [Methanomethylovorans sp.]
MTATESRDINGWPLNDGDYMIGNSDSPVAVVTLASDYKKLDRIFNPSAHNPHRAVGTPVPGDKKPGLQNYAICGTCF